MIRQIANRYILGNLIGQGGMADVYKATDIILNREVAVKILRSKLSDDPMILVRFQREASAASRLSHPNVVDIYDVGEYEGMHYIVMEYIRGRTLKQLVLRRGAIDVDEAVGIMKQLTSAVADAHHHSIIHRDIKPQNVLVKDDGTVKITDFGIAVAADTVMLTVNNAVMGSAHYLAPETAQGKEPNPRIDIYSLGIVFYELLTGEVPFRGKTPTEIAIKHLKDPVPSVRKFNAAVPQSVENIIIHATAKDPAQRYATADEMLEDLDRCLKYPDQPRLELAPGPRPVISYGDEHLQVVDYEPEEPVKKKKPSKVQLWAAGLCVGLLLFAGAFFLTGSLGWIQVPGFFGWQAMPDLTGLSQEEAQTVLNDVGLNDLKLVWQDKVSDSVAEGGIIQTEKKSGTPVRNGQAVVAYVSKGPSYLIGDYTGRYLDDVIAELMQNGVSLNIETEEKGQANTNPGIILEQRELQAGDRVDPDADERIVFVVSKYPSLTIPETLVGMNVDEAKVWLNDQGIAVVTRQNGYSGANKVTYTDPPAGSEYTQEGTNSVVTLYYD